MDKIKNANLNVHKYLMDKNLKTWLRAFFEVDRGCEAIENGFSECFNSVIVNVRHKPLLTMLEAIRVIVLERMNKMREIHRKWNPGVRSGSERFTVDEGKRTCSCRMWQLSRLPCVYATKSMYSTVLPPEPRKIPGRPKKKRIRAIGEGGSSARVSKVGSQGSCSNCKQLRHSKSSCKEPIVEQTPKPKGVPGRPRKKESVNDLKDVDVHRGPVRDEGVSETRGCTIGSRGRGGKKVVGTSGFTKWFGLQDELDHTQAEAQQTQQEPEQTQVEDQVEQTEDQAEIDLTQVEKTQEQT
nr:hypothetical protein [Tanacetum cinerariifolium]